MRVINPIAEGLCQCKHVENDRLKEMVLVGKGKLGEMISKLLWCEANAYIDWKEKGGQE